MATVQELLVKITGDASQFKKAVNETKSAATEIGSAFESVGAKITSIGKTATATLTVPIAAASTAAVKNFAEVDKTMQLTNATMANTEQEAKLLESAMEGAAQTSVFGMQDAATATLNFARAGLTAKEAADALAPAMNLAAGEGGDLDIVSQGLVATINGFGDSFSNASAYADVFANACNNSALDVNSLADAMSIAAPIFSAAGYSINDAALYMGVMADAGIPASEAANSLKTGLARLISPAKEGSEWLDQLGVSVTNADGSMKDSLTIQRELHDAFANLSESEQIAAASAIFGKNQMSKWLALINTAPADVEDLSKKLEQQGTTIEMADAMMSGFGGSLERLKSSIDVASYSFGQALAPAISKVATQIQNLVNLFNSLSEEQQQAIAQIAVGVAALGPILIVVGKLVSGVGGIITLVGKLGPMLSNLTSLFSGAAGATEAVGAAATTASVSLGTVATVVGIVIVAIIDIVAAIYSLIESFGGVEGTLARFKQAFSEIVASVKKTAENLGLSDKIDRLKEKFKELLSSLGDMKSFWEIVITVLTKVAAVLGSNLVSAFNLVIDVITAVIGLMTGIIKIISGLADIIVGVFTGDMDKAANGFKKIWEGVATWLEALVVGIISIVLDLVQNIIQFFASLKYNLIGDPIVIDLVEGILNYFNDLFTKSIQLFSSLVEKVIQFFTNLKDKVIELAQKIKDKVVELFTTVKQKVIELAQNLKDKVVEHFTTLKEKVIEKATQLKDKAQEKFTELKTAIVNKMKEVVDDVKQKVDELVSKFDGIDLTDIGKNVVSGFLKGLKSGWDDVKDWVSDSCSSIKGKFESAMKIGSPSKLFFQYGKWIDEGLVNGLNSGLPDINGAIDKMNQNVSTNFNAIVGDGAMGANQTINLNGDYMFQDKASMDYFLNRMQLAIQRA